MVIGISIIGVPISCLAAWFFTRRYRRRTDRTKIRKLMVWGLVAYGLLVFFVNVGLDLIRFFHLYILLILFRLFGYRKPIKWDLRE